MMRREQAAESPDAYVAALSGWRRALVEELRTAVVGAGQFSEVIKWGHIVYLANGPAALIRAEDERVLFGMWRGKRLREIEPRLKASGKYELATMELREGDMIDPQRVHRLAAGAIALNETLGDPTKLSA